MPKQTVNSNPIWLSLDQMLKYIKGNLLGKKKDEVEDHISASPLISEAIEGLRKVKNPEKLQKTIDSINRQIQLKTGANAVEQVLNKQSTHSSHSFSTLWAVAASVGIFAMASATIWFFVKNNTNKANSGELLHAEKETVAALADKEDQNAPGIDSTKTLVDSTLNNKMLAFQLEESEQNATKSTDKDERVQTKNDLKNQDTDLVSKKETANATEKKKIIASEAASNNKAKGLSATVTSPPNNENTTAFTDSAEFDKEETTSNDNEPNKSKSAISSDGYLYKQSLEYIKSNELEKAKASLNVLANSKNNEFQDDAIWNLAQIHLKEGDDREAKKLLKKIRNSDKYGALAKEALDKL